MEPRVVILIISSSILVLDLFLFGVVLYAYFATFYSPKKRKVYPVIAKSERDQELVLSMKITADKLREEAFEPVYITGKDKTTLFGRYYHVRDGAPLFIEFHGYRGEAYRDFAGGDLIFKTLKRTFSPGKQAGTKNVIPSCLTMPSPLEPTPSATAQILSFFSIIPVPPLLKILRKR